MEVYVITFIFSFLPFYFSQRTKKHTRISRERLLRSLFWWIAFIPLWLVAGLRYYNGADYGAYIEIFRRVESGGNTRAEWGYQVLCKVIAFLGGNATTSIVISSFIICYFFLKGIADHSDNAILSFWLFLFTATYIDAFNTIRQYIAASLFFYAIPSIEKGELKRYFAYVLCGMLFHSSAIVLLPLYILRYFKFDRVKSVALCVALLTSGDILYQLLLAVLSYTPYQYYAVANELGVAVTKSSMVYVLTITLIGYLVYKKNRDTHLDFMFGLQTSITVVVLLSLVIPFSRRLQMYFLPLEMYCIPAFLKRIKNRFTRNSITIGILIMYAVIILYAVYVKGYYTAVPYRCVLFQ